MKIFFILLIILGIYFFSRIKSRENKISIYNRVNNNDKSQEKRENKNEINNQHKEISQFIKMPLILDNSIYSKSLILFASSIITAMLLLTNIIAINLNTFFTI